MTEDQAWDYLELQQKKAKSCLQMMSKVQTNEGQQHIIQCLTERVNELEAQIHEAVLAEREACAQVCEEGIIGDNSRHDYERMNCASLIRARTSK